VYGRQLASVLRDNAETQVFYRPADQGTADFLEHALGRKSDMAYSQTLREGAEASEGHSEQGVPLMTAQEARQMRDEDILLFHRRLPPIQAERMDWRRLPLLRTRHGLPPPAVPQLPPLSDSLPALRPQQQPFTAGFIDPDMAMV
jgi:type IV secretory pathway TraG/TraD family ATPase VirD4